MHASNQKKECPLTRSEPWANPLEGAEVKKGPIVYFLRWIGDALRMLEILSPGSTSNSHPFPQDFVASAMTCFFCCPLKTCMGPTKALALWMQKRGAIPCLRYYLRYCDPTNRERFISKEQGSM